MNKGMNKEYYIKIFRVNIRITNCTANHISHTNDVLNRLKHTAEPKSIKLKCDKLLHYSRSQGFLA